MAHGRQWCATIDWANRPPIGTTAETPWPRRESLLRCHYNFVRPHGALKFGREVRTPAMQAGLATRRLTFREIFVGQPPSLLVLIRIGAIACAVQGRLPTAPGGDELAAA